MFTTPKVWTQCVLAFTAVFCVLLGGVADAEVLRVIVTPKYEIQPYDSSLTPCPNVSNTACFSGWPRLNARLRQLRSEVTYSAFVNSIDESSRLVLFHPDAYSVNHPFAIRAKADASTIEGYVLMSPLEKRSVAFAAKAPVLPLLSNIPAPTVLVAQLVRGFSAVKVGPYNIIIMSMLHSTKTVYPLWDEVDTLRTLLPPLKDLYNPDLVVLKMVEADSIWVDWSQRLDGKGLTGVDVVIGLSSKWDNTTIIQRNGTTYIMQGLKGLLLGVVDIDLVTRAISYKEQNLLTEISPALSSAQEYKDDVAFLKTYVDTATKNDPVIGTSTGNFSLGRVICRMHECEQGNFWTNVLWDAAPGKIDVCLMNGGAMRAGWNAGPFKLSYLFGSAPFQEQACVISMWGSDLWAMMNYSVYAAPRFENDTAGYDGTGRFLQSRGMRMVYNSNRNLTYDGSKTKISVLEIWNPEKKVYETISRRRIYRIVTTRYICNGGDGYVDYIKPTDGFLYLAQEIHNMAQQWITTKQTVSPFLDGHIYRDLKRYDEFMLTPISQTDCPVNTYWVPSVRDCDPCPFGYEQPMTGQMQCIPISGAAEVNIGLIVGCVVGGIILIAIPIAWKLSEDKRRMAKLLNNDKVASELAESVANMRFDEVAYLDTIETPTRIQSAFIKIVASLKEFRSYMPASLIGGLAADEEEEETPPGADEIVTPAQGHLKPSRDDGSRSAGKSVDAASRASSRQANRKEVMSMDVKSKRITVMVLNIKGYNKQFAKLSTNEASALQALYVKTVSECVNATKGTPDVFLGDRFLATWNTIKPIGTHRSNGCTAALQSSKGLKESGLVLTGGISSSEVKCGNMGCDGMKKFTFIGTCASLAPILDRLNRSYGTSFMIDGAVEEEAQNNFMVRKIDHVMVSRLQDRPIKIFEVCSSKAHSEDEWMYQLQDSQHGNPHASFSAAVDLYLKGMFNEALDSLSKSGADNVVDLFKARITKAQEKGVAGTVELVDLPNV